MAYVRFFESWPDVNVNCGETELQIFTCYFSEVDQKRILKFIIDQRERVKDARTSNEYRKRGNMYYKQKSYDDAMKSYIKAIVTAPRDSEEFGLSVANRSAVLFDLKRYKDCLVDIERVMRTEYSKNMMYKIFIRQANCYVELKHYAKASKAIQNAKNSLETAKDTLSSSDIDGIVKKISALEKSLEKCPIIEHNIADDKEGFSLPDLTNGENPQFTYASNVVAMRENERRGRHVVANVDITKGDVLFVEEPYSSAMLQIGDRSFLMYCCNCFNNSLTCIPCSTCVAAVFCSDHCRQQYWNARHRWECAGTRRYIFANELSLALGVLFRTSHTGMQTVIRDEGAFGNRRDNYPYVHQLMTFKQDIPHERYVTYVKVAVYLVTYLVYFTDYLDWLYVQEQRPDGSREELYRIVGGMLLRILCQIDGNMEMIMDVHVGVEDQYNIGMNRHKLAIALFVSSNMMNHACIPNAVKSFHGNSKVVRALTDIKKDSEVTICYLKDINITDRDSRRRQLLEEYYFTCTCALCAEDSFLFPWLCIRCRGRALTTAADNLAKCADCQHVFRLDEYKQIEATQLNLGLYFVTKNFSCLNKTFQMMKRIYHETNWILSIIYVQYIHYYERRDDFKSCLEYTELMSDLYKAIYGNAAADETVNMLLKHCLTLVNHCLALKYRKPGLYKKFLKRAKQMINSCREVLEYYMRKDHVDSYQQNMFRILEVGDPDFAKTELLFHCNMIQSE